MLLVIIDYNYSLLTGLVQNHAFWTSPMCFNQIMNLQVKKTDTVTDAIY